MKILVLVFLAVQALADSGDSRWKMEGFQKGWNKLSDGFSEGSAAVDSERWLLTNLDHFLIGRIWYGRFIHGQAHCGRPGPQFESSVGRFVRGTRLEDASKARAELADFLHGQTVIALSNTSPGRQVGIAALVPLYCQFEDLEVKVRKVDMQGESGFTRAFFALYWGEGGSDAWRVLLEEEKRLPLATAWHLTHLAYVPRSCVRMAKAYLETLYAGLDGSGSEMFHEAYELIDYRCKEQENQKSLPFESGCR